MEKHKIQFESHGRAMGEVIVDNTFMKMMSEPWFMGEHFKSQAIASFIYMLKDQFPKGNMAELGVYKGGTTKFIATLFPDNMVYAFDTFEGMPEEMITDKDDPNISGLFKNVNNVFEYLDNPNILIKEGLFPSTTEGLEDEKFSFVHLDADIYKSTLAGLEFFWPRMIENGIIIMDDFDFDDAPGVKLAFEDYFGNNPPYLKSLLNDPITEKPHIVMVKKTL